MDGDAGECGECRQHAAKYRCPRCMLRTCSLQCCLAHKQRLGCSGERDKIAFRPVAEMTDAHVRSDYFFLEEGLRQASSAKRRLALELGGVPAGAGRKRRRREDAPAAAEPQPQRPPVPPRLRALVRRANERGVDLRIMPQGMRKREANATRWQGREARLRWHVELVFVVHQGEARERVTVAGDFDEGATLEEALAWALARKPGVESAALRQRLRDFVAAGPRGVLAVMRREFCRADEQQYYHLDVRRTLRELLVAKVVIEFPVVVVDLPAFADDYPRVPPSIEVLCSSGSDSSSSDSDSEDEGEREGEGDGEAEELEVEEVVVAEPEPEDDDDGVEDMEVDAEVFAAAKAELLAACGLEAAD